MSLTSIFSSGLAGLSASQSALRVVSQNIANVNTPGFVRTEAIQQARTQGGSGSGVEIVGYRRAVDQFLSAAAVSAAAAQGASDIRANFLDRAQSALGDPNSESSLFASLSATFSELTNLTSSPNALTRSGVVTSLQNFLAQLSSASQQIEGLRVEAELTLAQQAQTASGLMSMIADLNAQIRVLRASGGDATTSENAQAQMIDELSKYVDIRVTQKEAGGVEIRTSAGALLVGDSAASITYSGQNAAYMLGGKLELHEPSGVVTSLEGLLRGGSIAALIDVRNNDIRALSDSLGAFAGVLADQINAIHNQNSAVPAPSSLTGRNTGLVGADVIGLTGRSTIAIVNPAGVLLRTVDVDFTNGTYSIDGGGAVSYGGPGSTVAQMVAGIDTALTGFADMSFANGVMNLTTQSLGNGIVVQQDASTPSSANGRSFSHYFGLNDLITRQQPLFYFPALVSTAHNLAPGGEISFRVTDNSGRVLLERSVGVTGATWADMVTALNDPTSGLGSYGTFAFSGGRLTLTSAAGSTVEIVGDTTQRGSTGMSISAMSGLDRYVNAARAADISVNASIVSDARRLGVGRANLSGGIGSTVLETGDVAGASELVNLSNKLITFNAFGAMSSQTVTLQNYLANIGGEAGRRAQAAESASEGASALFTAAAERRSTAEGVNLDDELVKMTTYQQSYAAASRVIQAAKDMFDVLLSIK